MALATDRIAVITENLTDAGLDEKGIAECLQMLDNNEFAGLQKYLADYRRGLLDSVHAYNDRIECLDYFIYSLNKSLEVD